ncbi:MAG: amino acid adenylation domain-containing protein [Anaerolineae bacterium]|nr:amino acid adenylation domain-containing protein [Anaerolineae bacterium]
MDNLEDIYELTPMQQGLLFETLYAPDAGIYTRQALVILRGNLNVSIWQQAWQEVIARHAILRTSFHWEDLDKPLQVVYQQVEAPWTILDWCNLSETEQSDRLQNFIRNDQRQVFALDQAPLIRLALIRTASDRYSFLWSYHHILLDGWCLSLLFNELRAFYETLSVKSRLSPEWTPSAQPLTLPQPRPYRDYIGWLQSRDRTKTETFWRNTLRGFWAATPLPLTEGRASHEIAHRSPLTADTYGHGVFQLPTSISTALQKLARQHHLTLNTLFQGAWALLLSRYSGDNDVVFGATVSGRPADLIGVETMVGLFINTLPVRIQVAEEMDLLTWLQHIQTLQQERENYGDSTLADIQSWSDVPHGQPLFESLLIFENYPIEEIMQQPLNDLLIEHYQTFEQTNYPLTVGIMPGDKIRMHIGYDTHYFSQEMIEQLAKHLQQLLLRMTQDPQQRITDLSPLTETEWQQLVITWNDNQAAYPADTCIHHLFESQVQHRPDAIAVVYKDQHLTYNQLNEKANQLAAYLQSLGVGPDRLVGIYIERSLDMVVGVLAILKAGGAYVPLDPDYPPERLVFMLADAQISILLTQSTLVGGLPTAVDNLICLDTDWLTIVRSDERAQPHEQLSDPGTTPDHLAYVIYTSGSTGQPKGIQVPHRGLCNVTREHIQALGIEPNSRSLQFVSFSFDVATSDLFMALCSGASLYLVLDRNDFNGLSRLINEQTLTHIAIPPMALTTLPDQRYPHLQTVYTGAEVCPIDTVRRWAKGRRFVNGYGPAETTITATIMACIDEGCAQYSPHLPIGYPVANTQIYLLDHRLQPVPVGVTGELYIGGVQLTRGYLNQPGLTAERFIPHPFATGERLYRTGDLARYIPNGSDRPVIEFRGRVDHQIKIRGFRVELGEIEAVLNQHPAIQASAVIAREDQPGDKRLVAYLVNGQPSSANRYQATIDQTLIPDLREHVKRQLPDYMIPATFMILEELPLSPNGKVDRQALPEPIQTSSKTQALPRTPAEQAMATIWGEVLGLDQVGIHDNFFDLGGHSLLATQVISRVQQTFQVELTLRDLMFEYTDVASLAEALTHANQATISPIEAADRTSALPLSFAQQRLWFLDQLDGPNATYNIPVALKIKGPLDIPALIWSLNEIIKRHEIVRTTFQTEGGEGRQIIHPPIPLHLPLIDLRFISGPNQAGEVERLIQAETMTPFDLSQDLMLRANLLLLDDDEVVFLLTMHHIASDAWSTGVIIREMNALYQAYTQGTPSALSDLLIQYADFATWQRQRLQGDELAEQLAYWQRQLAHAPSLLALPTDQPRPPQMSHRGASMSFTIPKQLSQRLQNLSQQTEATLFMTLLAAFKVLLYRYSGQTDIVVGSPIANRNRPEIEPLIGFFVNTLALRSDLSATPSFLELLDQVRETTQAAYDHQDIPFEMVVETVQPERNLSHTPLFQVMFDLHNVPQPALAMPDLSMHLIERDIPTAKFDLTLTLQEVEEGLIGSCEYLTDLFEARTIEQMIGHFQNLLASIVTDPTQSIAQLPLLTEAEQHHILVAWNDTQTSYASHQCVHHLFETQAARTPDAIAVVYHDQHLTYQQLNQRANQLAHYLQSLGVGPETLVGLYLERSLEMIISMLGVIKTGGAYIPLDPAYPPERLAFVLNDSQLSVLLTQEQLAPDLSHHETRSIHVDKDWPQIASLSSENLPSQIEPVNLAYVIYTSGSTGRPKGTLIEHRALTNFAQTAAEAFDLTSQDRVLQFASISFDTSNEEIYPCLIRGATLVLRSETMLNTPAEFFRQCHTQHLTVLDFPTGYWHELTNHLKLNALALPPVVRLVIIGGEQAQAESLALWQERVGADVQLCNTYGPTETTVAVTIWRLTETIDLARPVSIGRPTANTELYVLDPYLQPVPIGVAGELTIGGIQVARGYLHRPQLTAEKFIPNPFGKGRLYKTGDLARYRPDGNIEFLGRRDYQVKIRGFRVELGEIESALNQHPAVQASVVLAREDKPGDKRLVAYVVKKQEMDDRELLAELRRFLQGQLPDYMIPATFVVQETLPFTTSGKIDRRALPAPTVLAAPDYVPPRDSLEQQLVDIWQTVLNRTSIGIRDSFFEIGGHSLLAVRLMAVIQQQFDRHLPLATLFQYPTIADLARFLRQDLAGEPWSSLVALQPTGAKPPFFCVPGAGSNPFYLYHLSRHLGQEQPFYSFQAVGLDGVTAPHTSVEAMAEHYLEAIQQLQSEGPYYLGGHSSGGMVALEMAQQLLAQGRQVALLAIFDALPFADNEPEPKSLSETEWLVNFSKLAAELSGQDLAVTNELLHPLHPSEQLNTLKQRLEQVDLLPNGSDVKLLRGQIQVFKAVLQATAAYTARQIMPVPVTLFAAGNKPTSEHEWAIRAWSQIGPVAFNEVPGTHITMLAEPQVQVLAKKLSGYLTKTNVKSK